MNNQGFWIAFTDRRATRLLLWLLGLDLVFAALHLVNRHTVFLNVPRLDITLDQGYPEMFQYLKYLWCGTLLAVFALKHAAWHGLAWVSFFVYLFLDDALGIHETLGRRAASGWEFKPAWGLRLQDYGETLVTAAAGLVLLLPLGWAYRKGSEPFRRLSRDLALLALALVFVGVFVDMTREAVRADIGKVVSFALRMLEDLGEMIVASVMGWYVFFMFRRDFVSPVHLSDWVGRLIKPARQP